MPFKLAMLLLLLVLLLAGCSPATEHHADTGSGQETALEHAIKHLDPNYVCPMHPQIVRDAPGTCPICGMALVRREARTSEQEARAPVIHVPAATRQAMALRTAAVQRRDMAATARVTARVEIDQYRINHVHARVRGWVESLAVHAVGERIRAGQTLMEIYSPELSAAQEDYLIAIREVGPDSRAGRGAAVRLRALGVDQRFIDELAERRSSLLKVPLRAPASGVVTALNVRHGMYVEPATEVLEISDLDQVWIIAELFPEQLDRLGSEIFGAFRISGVPDRVWRGKADYIYPELNAMTQTVQLRFPVPNSLGHLRPGSFLDGNLRGEVREGVLVVPNEAVIRTADGERVVLEESEAHYRPIDVRRGHSAEGWTELLSGVEEGQRVVVNAQFLLDAESSLRAGLERFSGGGEHAH